MEVAINAAGHVFVVLLMVMMFAATIRFTFHRVLPAPTSDVVKLCTGVGWALLAILFSFGTIGEFARGEVSPVPWTEFSNRLPAHGWADACLAALQVTMTDLWWFFGLSQLILWDQETAQNLKPPEVQAMRRKHYLIINILVGLVVTTQGNTIYRLLATIISSE